jgi:hypothetical protein
MTLPGGSRLFALTKAYLRFGVPGLLTGVFTTAGITLYLGRVPYATDGVIIGILVAGDVSRFAIYRRFFRGPSS